MLTRIQRFGHRTRNSPKIDEKLVQKLRLFLIHKKTHKNWSWEPPGLDLGGVWEGLGPLLGPIGCLLGALGRLLAASWASLGRLLDVSWVSWALLG